MDAKEKIILALDVNSREEALELVRIFRNFVSMFKVGLRLFVACGPNLVKEIIGQGNKVFLDLKFNDTPKTVGEATKEASMLGVEMFTVHASAGISAMKEAIANKGNSKLLITTVLTSLSDNHLNPRNTTRYILGEITQQKVRHFSEDAVYVGADGITCSPQDLKMLEFHMGHESFRRLLKVTPGICETNDLPSGQKRTMTAREAILDGADYLVLSRVITETKVGSPMNALLRITAEISSVERRTN